MKTAHEDVKELLPWFVNGTLNESEQSLVDEHLEDCGECKADVDRLIQLAGPFSSPDPFDRVDAGAAAHAFVEALPERRQHGGQARRQFIATAAGFVIVAVGLVVALQPQQRFRTLTSTPAGAGDKDVVQVVFKPDATESTIREVLLFEGNVVLSGPSRLGVYRVAVSNEDSDVYIARLEHDPNVIFVEKETDP